MRDGVPPLAGGATLRGANLKLEEIRVLLKLSCSMKFLSHDSFR